MISRTWHGAVPIKHKQAFYEYEMETGIKESLSVKGNLGTYLHVVDQGEYAHFFLCTIWENMDSVRKFAGNTPHIAVTYPEDEAYQLISDPIVILQEVMTNCNPFNHINQISQPI